MKKRTKIINSILGTTAIGTGIIIATVAQACGNASQNTTDFTNTIVTGVNELSSYNRTTSPINTLAQNIIAVLNTSINSTVLTLNFDAITSANVSIVNTTHIVIINAVTGNIINGQTFASNNIVLAITNPDDPVVTVTSAEVSETTSVSQIITDINSLNGNINTTESLSAAMLASISTDSLITGTVTDVTFNNLIAGDFNDAIEGAVAGSGTITGTVQQVVVTASNTLTDPFATLVINYTGEGSSRELSFGSFSFDLEDTIIEAVNALSSYDSSAPPTNTLAQNIIAAINGINGLRSDVLTLTFNNITLSDISRPVNNIYLITINSATGTVNNGLEIDGNIVLTITDGSPLIVGITSVATTGTTSISQVISSINTLSVNLPPSPTGLAAIFLSVLEANAQVSGNITAISFTPLIFSNFNAPNMGVIEAPIANIALQTDSNTNITGGEGLLIVNYVGEGSAREFTTIEFALEFIQNRS